MVQVFKVGCEMVVMVVDLIHACEWDIGFFCMKPRPCIPLFSGIVRILNPYRVVFIIYLEHVTLLNP